MNSPSTLENSMNDQDLAPRRWTPLAAAAALAIGALVAPAGALAQTTGARGSDTSASGDLLDSVRLGARLQVDHGSFDGVYTDRGGPASATYLRRGEVSIGARLARDWRANAIVGVEDDKAVVDIAAVSWRPRDGLQLSVGRLDPDFGLDNSNSSSWTAGIERSAIWDLAPGIADSEGGWGLKVAGHGPHWHASAGLYDKVGPTAAVGRAVWIPVPAEDRVFQVGASLARTSGLDSNGRLRTRLGVRGVTEVNEGRRSDLAPAVGLPARYDADTVLGVELAWQQGPWLLQAEAMNRQLDGQAAAPARSVAGTSLQLAWSPSGVARRHDADSARFGRPKGDGREGGRWELFYRFDALDGVGGLAATVHTVGTSWFLGDRWRLSANAVSGASDDPNAVGDDSGLGLVFRAQAVF
jgi:phosphate-selective porin OprO/OprP